MLVSAHEQDSWSPTALKPAADRDWPKRVVTDKVEHLGVWYQQDNGCGVEVLCRASASVAWSRMGPFWTSRHMPCLQRVAVWLAVVRSFNSCVSTAVSRANREADEVVGAIANASPMCLATW